MVTETLVSPFNASFAHAGAQYVGKSQVTGACKLIARISLSRVDQRDLNLFQCFAFSEHHCSPHGEPFER